MKPMSCARRCHQSLDRADVLGACDRRQRAHRSLAPSKRVHHRLRESLLIGGWVAMWRPLEVFLYDWWPIRAEARLYDRLAAMPVRIQYAIDENSDAWRDDWPVAPR